jgi:drug/metabolite transporter (DMT)-like permease
MGEEDMNITITLILSLAAALIGGICKKYYTDKFVATISGGFFFNAVGCITSAVILLCLGGFGNASVFTVLLGLLFGAVTAFQGITNILALGCGPMSYTSVIISFSTLISALSGLVFFGESIGWAQIVGIVLMLGSFVLATKTGTEKEKKANLKWFLLCLAAFAATGGIGIMQKVHQSSGHSSELNAFLIIAFITSAIFCTLFAVALNKKSNRGEEHKQRGIWHMLGIMLVSGVCIAINNKFNLYLSGVMDSAIFFPIVNGGGLVLTTLAAVLLFKEKLSAKQWVGIVLGIISVVFLCNPFS